MNQKCIFGSIDMLTWVRESDPRGILYELIFEVSPDGIARFDGISQCQYEADDPHDANSE